MEIIKILFELITILAKLAVDITILVTIFYICIKILRGYNITFELKTTKPKKP